MIGSETVEKLQDFMTSRGFNLADSILYLMMAVLIVCIITVYITITYNKRITLLEAKVEADRNPEAIRLANKYYENLMNEYKKEQEK